MNSLHQYDETKFPIGPFESPTEITSEALQNYISAISTFPQRLKKEVELLSDAQLDTPYRTGGWTIRQVVHHCADSHMNSLIRFKLALTEDQPTIKPYFEDRWAELDDSRTMPIASSLKILEGVHERWTLVLNSLSNEQFTRTFVHPEHRKPLRVYEATALYAWHCNHHLAHITTYKSKMNW